MNPEPIGREPSGDDEIVFRTLAAPGLEEDDVFAAMDVLPASGRLWGDGMPSAFPSEQQPWDTDTERRRRHAEMMTKWSSPDAVA